MTESAAATTERLLDAAESAFASTGVEEASLRAIMRAAGVHTAAVTYHFGDRASMARAVLDRLLAPLNARRLQLLADASAEAGGRRPIPLAILVGAIIGPDLEAAAALDERGRGRSRLIGVVYLQPSLFVKELVEAHFAPVAARFMPHLIAAVPHVAPDELAWRVRWSLFGLVGALLLDPDTADSPTDRDHARILAVATAALAAPAAHDRSYPPQKERT